jgi:integrase
MWPFLMGVFGVILLLVGINDVAAFLLGAALIVAAVVACLRVGQHPKYVQELLGHANISITLDVYSHVLPGMGDGLADAMDGALGG